MLFYRPLNLFIIRRDAISSSFFTKHFQYQYSKKSFESSNSFIRLAKEKIPIYLTLIRIQRPIGTLFTFFPAAFAITIAGAHGFLPDFALLGKFLAGAFFARSAACIINDYVDADIDAKVARTRTRPIPSKKVSTFEVYVLSTIFFLLAFSVLISLNKKCIPYGVACVPMIIAYPFFKRFTYFPHLMLGIVSCMGILTGWPAVREEMDFNVIVPLFMGTVFWFMFNDTIYGYQDIVDDLKIGVKSLSIRLSSLGIPRLALSLLAISSVLCWAIAGYNTNISSPFYASIALVAAHYFYQVYTLDIKDVAKCSQLYFANKYLGFILLCGIILGVYFQKDSVKNV